MWGFMELGSGFVGPQQAALPLHHQAVLAESGSTHHTPWESSHCRKCRCGTDDWQLLPGPLIGPDLLFKLGGNTRKLTVQWGRSLACCRDRLQLVLFPHPILRFLALDSSLTLGYGSWLMSPIWPWASDPGYWLWLNSLRPNCQWLWPLDLITHCLYLSLTCKDNELYAYHKY